MYFVISIIYINIQFPGLKKTLVLIFYGKIEQTMIIEKLFGLKSTKVRRKDID